MTGEKLEVVSDTVPYCGHDSCALPQTPSQLFESLVHHVVLERRISRSQTRAAHGGG